MAPWKQSGQDMMGGDEMDLFFCEKCVRVGEVLLLGFVCDKASEVPRYELLAVGSLGCPWWDSPLELLLCWCFSIELCLKIVLLHERRRYKISFNGT